MAAAARLGDYCTGHGCWPPRTGVTASNNVFVNGIRVHRLTDTWNIHCCPNDGCHIGSVASGSASVFINGLPAARIGDSISCGSLIAMGSPNVSFGSSRSGGGAGSNSLSGIINFAENFIDFGDFGF